MPAPISVLKVSVASEWVDYNDHMRDAFYLYIFSLGIDQFMELIGMGDGARKSTKTTIYTLEAHLNYLRETKKDEIAEVRAQLLGFDAKRFHLFMWMHIPRLGAEPAATAEFMLLNVDNSGEPKSAPFRVEVAGALDRIWSEHRQLPRPGNAGRSISLPKK